MQFDIEDDNIQVLECFFCSGVIRWFFFYHDSEVRQLFCYELDVSYTV